MYNNIYTSINNCKVFSNYPGVRITPETLHRANPTSMHEGASHAANMSRVQGTGTVRTVGRDKV